MKKRNIYLILLSSATAAAIILGTLWHVGKPVFLHSDGNFSFYFPGKNNTQTTQKLESFTGLRISLQNNDIELKTGNGYEMTYVGPKDAVPTAKTADGTLTVSDSVNSSTRTGGILTITFPSDLEALQDVTLDTANGDICIEPNDIITVKNLSLTSENGDLSLLKCHGSVLKASADNGDIGMEHVSFDQSDLSSENGDLIVNLDDSIKNYTVSPSTTSGDITIGETTYSTTDGEENKITIGSGAKVLKLRTQSGDIDVED
jgi:DUF4097 and DUF4098 domain-containing protein YvlB